MVDHQKSQSDQPALRDNVDQEHPNDIFWGLGIKNETYFVLAVTTRISGKFIKNNQERERYSTNHHNYLSHKLRIYLDKMFADNEMYRIPRYLNSHSFNKTDITGEHTTLVNIGEIIANPKFNGKTVNDLFIEFDPMFQTDMDCRYTFDQDTIKFMTQDFYKQTVDRCVTGLVNYKSMFLHRINEFMVKHHFTKLAYPKINYGIVRFGTNPQNVSFFNQGTYCISLTMPTKLDSQGKIVDPDLFKMQHQNAIRLIQWIEPLIIALYGSPDVFSFNDYGNYSAGSLRLTKNSNVGVGTFDTKLMKHGEQPNDAKEKTCAASHIQSWYNQIYQRTDYQKGGTIGYDINYGIKIDEYLYGIEFRILDYFPEEAVTDLINFIILLLDHSLCHPVRIPACNSNYWNEFVAHAVLHGYLAEIPDKMVKIYHNILKLPLVQEKSVSKYLEKIIDCLYLAYSHDPCSSLMSPGMHKPQMHNMNRYMWEANFLQYIPTNNANHLKSIKLFHIYLEAQAPNYEPKSQEKTRLYNLLLSIGLCNKPDLNLSTFYRILLETKLDVKQYILNKL